MTFKSISKLVGCAEHFLHPSTHFPPVTVTTSFPQVWADSPWTQLHSHSCILLWGFLRHLKLECPREPTQPGNQRASTSHGQDLTNGGWNCSLETDVFEILSVALLRGPCEECVSVVHSASAPLKGPSLPPCHTLPILPSYFLESHNPSYLALLSGVSSG